jgi:hypothetical protein
MRQIFRGAEAYGPGTPSEQATRFRFERMMPEIVERALRNSGDVVRPDVDLLVSLAGFSPATTILAYELLRPARVLAVYSEEATEGIDAIHQHLVLSGRLRASDFNYEPCNPTDPLGIYEIVKRRVVGRRSDGQRQSAIIDITGGKKVMSATAALAAWQLDLPLCYVDSVYDAELRQPVPGSERLLILPNPTAIFGDNEMQAALAMFRNGAYEAARERFGALSESISEPGRARFLRDLSDLYRSWCDLDLPGLPGRVARVRAGLADPQSDVRIATAARLGEQLTFLDELAADAAPSSFLLNFFLLGLHYADLHRLDFAALLYYRTIEGCFQERLHRLFPGFRCDTADYTLLPAPLTELRESCLALRHAIHLPGDPLPNRLGLIDSAVLLSALDDPMLRKLGMNDRRALSHLNTVTEARNRSVLAHGLASVTPKQSNELHSLAQRGLRALWALHHPDEEIDARCERLRLLRET